MLYIYIVVWFINQFMTRGPHYVGIPVYVIWDGRENPAMGWIIFPSRLVHVPVICCPGLGNSECQAPLWEDSGAEAAWREEGAFV